MQEQDVSMVVMKVNTKVDAVNEERFLNLKHLSWGTQKWLKEVKEVSEKFC